MPRLVAGEGVELSFMPIVIHFGKYPHLVTKTRYKSAKPQQPLIFRPQNAIPSPIDPKLNEQIKRAEHRLAPCRNPI